MNNTTQKAVFTETQKFDRWWVWAILVLALIPNFIIIGNAINNDIELTAKDVLFHNVIMAVVLVLFIIMKLKTEVTKSGIKFTYIPFYKRTIAWSEIASLQLLKYGFVGYGIRLSFKYGTVYNTKGNKGLSIVLKNGEKLIIGTQKPEELKQIIENQNLEIEIISSNFLK